MKLKGSLAAPRLRRTHLASVSLIALGLLPSLSAQAAETTVSTALAGTQNWYGTDYVITSTGSITGGGTGLVADAGGDAFSNAGSITGDTTGMLNEGSINPFSNDGIIQGAGVGFENTGYVTTLSNNADGIIRSTGAHSVAIQNSGTIVSLVNAGEISADPTGMNGIYNTEYGTIGSITNSGMIKGSLYAISNYGDIGPMENSGIIAGNIRNNSSLDLTINGGSSVMGTLTGYDEVSIGTITNNNSDVIFNSGKLLLNSNIVVSGNAARNTGADLRVNNAITITGDYIQTGGSLISGVSSSSVYGNLTVTGNASLSDTDLVLFDINGSIATGQSYTLVNAGGTLTATDLSTTVNGFEASYQASGQNLIVTLGNAVGGGSGANYYSLGNEVNPFVAQMGLFIDVISVSNHPDAVRFQTNVLPAINALTDAQKKQMLFDVAVGWLIFGGTNGMSAQNFIGALLSFRITDHQGTLKYASNGGSGISAGDEITNGNMWGQIIGGTASRDASIAGAGFDSASYGMIIGVDQDITEELTAGIALSWIGSNTDSTNSGAGGDADSYTAALYGTWTPLNLGERFHLDGQMGIGFSDYAQHHTIHAFGVRADADYHGWQYFANAVASYDFPVGDKTVLTPYLGLRVTHTANDGFTETGAGLLNMTVDDYSNTAFSHDVGVRVSTSFDTALGTVSPTLKLGWLHDYGGAPASVTGAMAGVTFSAPSAAISENGLAIGAALDIARSDTLTLGFDYNGDLRSDYQSHTASLKATIRF
jgi:outer membrane autotransporter protein